MTIFSSLVACFNVINFVVLMILAVTKPVLGIFAASLAILSLNFAFFWLLVAGFANNETRNWSAGPAKFILGVSAFLALAPILLVYLNFMGQ